MAYCETYRTLISTSPFHGKVSSSTFDFDVVNPTCFIDWALPDQLVFSTISALLRVSNESPYSEQATAAIYSFISEMVERAHSSTCKLA